MLSKTLSGEEVPRIDIFINILSALGCKLAIQSITEGGTSSDIKLTGEKDITKFDNLQTQLAESDST